MKKILSFLFVIIGLLGYSQDEYYRKVDWKFYPENVIQLTDSTYLTDAYPLDYNDVGAIQRVVGNYVVDFVGHRYEVIDSTTTTITVLDIYHIGQAPQTGQIARCYRSVGDGEAEYIGSIDYSPLDESSRWKLNGSDNELLWRQTIGKAENGLHKDFRTVKLGGDLIEPTTINQDDNSLKILNNGHGSVFSENGIAYTKIDTVDFTDSTLVTKKYVKSLIKEDTDHDSLTIAPGSTGYFEVKYPQIFSGQKLIDSLGVITSTIQATTGNFTNLTDGYIPCQTNGKLANSQIYKRNNGYNLYGYTDNSFDLGNTNNTSLIINNGWAGNYNSKTELLFDLGSYGISAGISALYTSWSDAPDGGYGADLIFTTKTATTPLTERVRINNIGNVGIGTSNPINYIGTARNLQIVGESYAAVTLGNTSNAVDNKFWRMISRPDYDQNIFEIQTIDDAGGSEQTAIEVKRSGTNIVSSRIVNGSFIVSSLSGTGTRLVGSQSDGTLDDIALSSGYFYSDGTNMSWIKTVPQSLSGTTPSLNASNGVNANLSISGATTLTLSNLISGTSGTIYLTNNASVYRIKIAGYTIAPASNITYDSTGILLPASSVYSRSSIGWYYNGTTVQIHKADYNTTTY